MARIKGGIKETRKRQARFLELFEEHVLIETACKKMKLGRRNVYNWIASDELFKQQFEEAKRRGFEAMEDEAKRRAFQGVTENVYQGGKKVGTVRKFSDTLLIFMLKHNKKEVYTETVRQEHTGQNGEPIQTVQTVISNVDYTQIPTSALDAILKARIDVKDAE